jgi:transposase
MLKMDKYKLRPNRKQSIALQHTLDVCRDIWNLSLEERKMHHDCEKCGYATHRDTAAARIILARMEPLGANEGGVTPCGA